MLTAEVMLRRLLPLAVAVGLTACETDSEAPESDLSLFASSTPAGELVVPGSREGFLHVLAPMPSDGLTVSYVVSGPAGLNGSLEILVAPGGRRREVWSLELPMPDGESRWIEESATQTEDYIWTGSGDGLEVQRAPLGAIADAYLRLPHAERKQVVESLDAFRRRIVDARVEHPGPRREVLGVPCLATRLAAQELCVWEQTGLPLEYRGNAFSLELQSIDEHAEVPAHAFAVPAAVEQAAPSVDLDPAESLDRLARRDYAELGPLLHPGLRLPLG